MRLLKLKRWIRIVYIAFGIAVIVGGVSSIVFRFDDAEQNIIDIRDRLVDNGLYPDDRTIGGGDPCHSPFCKCVDRSCWRECCTPATSIGLVDEIFRELDWGNIAFDAPATMSYKQPQVLNLLLSPTLSVVQLQAQVDRMADVETATARISNRMEAQLMGKGFAIEALTPSLQAITSEQVSHWQWRVTPTEHGSQRLRLVLSALIHIAGRDAPLVVRTFDRTIEVEISVPQRVSGFIERNWQWLWAAIVVPVVGYFWRGWKKRPEEDKEGDA